MSDGSKGPTLSTPSPGSTGIGPGRTIATASGALIVGILPMFLLGALSGRIGADLRVGGAVIGGLVALFFAAGAVSSIPAGRLTDRIGATAALRTAAVIAALCSIGVAALGAEVWILIVLFITGGTAIAMADTGGARAIAASIPTSRQGMAFGGKEASIPAASMLAGLSVPILGAQLGWRSAFGVAGGLALLFLLTVPRGLGPVLGTRDVARTTETSIDGRPGVGPARAPELPTTSAPEESGRLPTHTHVDAVSSAPEDPRTRIVLLILAVAAGLGGAAATATPTFLVPAAVAGGLGESTAGFVLAGASIIGIIMRLTVGAVADRRQGGEIRLTAVLLAIGTVGLLALSSGATAATVGGAVLAIGGGWGWTGLVFLAAVRTQPSRPAGAAGTVLAGLATGGATGPVVFGWIADGPGYPTAWSVAACAMFVACLLGLLADQRRRRIT